ncbi:hypothetical protein A6R68_13384 [Neotoma lepida]|uniref:Uncharacterized protein n=1 Tax=Neotoma lepida TaxID=56216 RepID=A0A1A6H356_NEOLE|nr:hypothetical protein A6R68_13384 [Neotoma lepida]
MRKSSSKRGPANVEDITGSGAMDAKEGDDIDLFGSEEESEEAKSSKKSALCSFTTSQLTLDACKEKVLSKRARLTLGARYFVLSFHSPGASFYAHPKSQSELSTPLLVHTGYPLGSVLYLPILISTTSFPVLLCPLAYGAVWDLARARKCLEYIVAC